MFRDLYDLTKQERDAAVTALELEKSNSASLNKSYALAEREISTLNKALDRYAAAVALYEKSISMIETQRDEARADAKKAKKKTALTSLALIGLIAMKFLF
jgi:chromosome segregation ATPase